MVFAITFLFELVCLFFLSKLFQQKLSLFIYRTTRSQTATIYFMAFLFFPGTVIHELSHLIMAGLLFVRIGSVKFWPKPEGQHIKLGSVAIAETDIFRRFLIGAAPFIFGTSLLLGMLFYAARNNLFINQLYIILLGYAVFEIGNTMFSSHKDMEGALEFLGALMFFAAVFYFLGVHIPSVELENFFKNPTVLQIFQQGNIYLLAPLGINLLLLIIIKFIPIKRVV